MRAPCLLSLASFTSLCSALRSEIDETVLQDVKPSSDVDIGTGLGTAVLMLMQAADSFYASEEMKEERQEAASFNVAAGITTLGLEMQDRFRMFAVQRALQLSARSEAEGRGPWEDPEPTSAMELEDPHAVHGSRDWQANARNWQTLSAKVRSVKTYNKTCGSEDNLNHWLLEMECAYGSRNAVGTAGQARSHANLRNYCRLREIVQEKDAKISVSEDAVHRLMKETTASPRSNVDKSKLPPSPRNGIFASAADKRKFRKAEAVRNLRWISNWNASDLQQLKELFLRATIMNKRLTTLVDFLSANGGIDWMTVEPKKTGISNRVTAKVKFVSKFTVDFFKKLGKNTILFFTNCWNSFKLRLADSERKCKVEGEKGSKAAAKSGGLHTSTEEDSITRTVNRLSNMDPGDIRTESSRVESAMGTAIEDAETGALPEEEARAQMSQAAVTAKNLHRDLAGGNLGTIDDAEEAIEEVEKTVCKTRRKSALQHLKDVFRKTRNAFSSALKTSAPTLGIRGVGVSAAALGGGLEEVIDFRNREIAQFKWGTGFFGPSVTGVSLGGYSGVGWKGYKHNWTLQEAYVTGLWTGVSLSASMFGLNAGLSISFATDADNSIPGPWVPEPHGVNGITLGWSAGASITKAVVPMSADVGASYYWYLNSECFGSLSELIKYIWVPRCKDCRGASENAKIMAIRASINIPSFPFISETAFSILAAMYDRYVREPGHTPTECSPGSVTLRHDASHMIRQVGDLMFENARLLEHLYKRMDKTATEMSIAEKYNPTFEQSQEYSDWRRAAAHEFDTCSPVGPITQVQGEDDKKMMKELTEEDLLGLCDSYTTNYGLDLGCRASGETRETLQERLLNYEELKKGSFSVEEMDNLIHDVRPTSKTGQVLQRQKEMCEEWGLSGHDECMKSLKVLKIYLETLDTSKMLQLCKKNNLVCKRRTSKFCVWSCSTAYDKQALALKILVSEGGGSNDAASASDPFGTCTTDNDCFLENTKCLGDDEERYCQCKEDHCYTLVQNESNILDKSDRVPACKPRSKEWRGIHNQVKRNFLTYRYVLGQMMGQLKNLPSYSA